MTFSIVARCPKTFALGVSVSTAFPAVGSVVPHVQAEVGAVATQGQTNILYGLNGLKLLELGFSPQTALDAMLKEDSEREKRQVAIVDRNGETAAFTGQETLEWKGHLVGKAHVVAGNLLAGAQVVEAMDQSFRSSEGDLAARLLGALEAGQEAGGDRRGSASAALLVKGVQPLQTRSFIDLRVDTHPTPVRELRRVWREFKKTFQ